MDQRVSVITLGVGDLDRARRFYEQLGWTSPSVPEDGVVFFPVRWDGARAVEPGGPG